MAIARSLDETWPYILLDERDKEGATSFELGPLTQTAVEHKAAGLYRRAVEQKDSEAEGLAADAVLMAGGLRGWTLKDKSGQPVVFCGKGGATEADLRRLTIGVRKELGWEAFRRSQLIPEVQD